MNQTIQQSISSKTTSNHSNNIVSRLCSNWSTRATVRNGEFVETPEPFFDPDMKDFPEYMLPFNKHPQYQNATLEKRQLVETLSWISWNKRVVDTEELVISPALIAIMNGHTDLKITGVDRMAIRQTLVDEYFHSHMHEIAVGITVRGRNISDDIVSSLNRPACVYRTYKKAADSLETDWEKDIARLAWCVVGELSIYEFLGKVSADPYIQPASSSLLKLHERDEAAHASLIGQIMRDHFHEFGDSQKRCFVKHLPLAMDGFSQEDWVVWQDILELAEIDDAKQIVFDMKHDSKTPDNIPLLRSYQKVESFCSDLNIKL